MSTKRTKAEIDDDLQNNDTRRYDAFMRLATEIAQKQGFDAIGWNALYLLFAHKFNWTPAQVRSLSMDELSLFFHEFFE